MFLLRLFGMIPTLPAGVLLVMLAAVALVVYGGVSVWRRRIGRGLAFGGAGILALWGMATMLLSEDGPAPTTSQEAANARRLATVVGLCIAGAGAAAAAAAAGWLRSTWRFVRIAARTRGKIVDFTLDVGLATKEDVRLAVVAFRTETGDEHRFESQYWGNVNTGIGREVRVLYDRGDPKNARMHSLSLWSVPLLVGALGLVFFAAGLAVIFLEPG